MHICDWIPFKHRSKTSSKIPHFKLPVSEGTCRVVQACAMGCIIKHDGLTPMEGWGHCYQLHRTSLPSHPTGFYFCAMIENKEQQKAPAWVFHKKGNFLKTACLSTGNRDYSPFEYWYIEGEPEHPDGIFISAGWASRRDSNHVACGMKYSWASNGREGNSCGHWGLQLPRTGVLFGERGTCKTCAPGPQVGGVSKPVTSLCTLSLESYRCLQHCHQRR